MVLFDLKHVDLEKLRRVMGVKCGPILRNLSGLLDSPVAIELRMTLVPGFNASDDDLAVCVEWLKSVTSNPPELHLLPFQRLAAAKESIFGAPYPFREVRPLSDTALAKAAETLSRLGMKADYD